MRLDTGETTLLAGLIQLLGGKPGADDTEGGGGALEDMGLLSQPLPVPATIGVLHKPQTLPGILQEQADDMLKRARFYAVFQAFQGHLVQDG